MINIIKQRALVMISFFANFLTWIFWLLALRYFKEQETKELFFYSMVVFAIGIAYKLLKNRVSPMPGAVSGIEWPITLVLLHLVPLFYLIGCAIYQFTSGGASVNWAFMFISPFLAGTGLVNYFLIYAKEA